MAEIRKRMHFTPATDIDLLKEVIDRNPWASNSGWGDLSCIMRRLPDFSSVETKSIRDRVNLLIAKFRKDMLNLRKSENEEEYTEREVLLQEVSDLEAEHYRPRKRVIKPASTQRSKAAKIAASFQMAEIRKRMHFTPATDIDLLKEVIARDPWASKTGWGDLSCIMRRLPEFSSVERKSIRDRVNLLIAKFRKKDMLNLRKSGTEEEYTEREALLQEVSDLEAEHYRPRKRVINPASAQRSKAAKIAARITPLIHVMEETEAKPLLDNQSLNSPPESLLPDIPAGSGSPGPSYQPESPPPTAGFSSPGRGSRSNLLASYIDLQSTIDMEDKNFRERELLLKQEELNLRREEFQLHRQQVLHEQELSKRRLEMEEREIASVQKVMTHQMSLMESVLKLLNKN